VGPKTLKQKLGFGNLTAEGVNNFQKIFFPCLFVIFTFFFSLVAYFKVGDVEPEDLNA
jgi:hypothetical protein